MNIYIVYFLENQAIKIAWKQPVRVSGFHAYVSTSRSTPLRTAFR